MFTPSPSICLMAGRPGLVPGILTMTLGRPARWNRSRAMATVPSVSIASRGPDVLQHQLPEDVLGVVSRPDHPDQRFGVVGRAADRLFEDGRIGRDAAHPLFPQAGQLPGGDELAPDVVEPEALAQSFELLDRAGAHQYPPVDGDAPPLPPGRAEPAGSNLAVSSNLRAAPAMSSAEIPAASISSSGLPDVGRSRTAQCATRGGLASPASASITAAPRPPCG